MREIYYNANKLLETELNKLNDNQITDRIRNDNMTFIRLVAYKVKNKISSKEKKLISKSDLIWFSNTVNYKLSIRIIYYLLITQFLLTKRWIKSKTKLWKVKIIFINSINEDLFNHIKIRPSFDEFQIIIPIYLIIFKRYFSFKRNSNSNKNINSRINNLKYDINLIYLQKLKYYLKVEEIGDLIIIFINYIKKYSFIRSIEILSSSQSYLENYILMNNAIKNKKFEGVFIALHGGIYSISCGYPIMFYHFKDDLKKSPKYLMPKEFFNHFHKDLFFYSDKKPRNYNLVKTQYGFQVLNQPKRNICFKKDNNDVYIFANNLYPPADPYIKTFAEYEIQKTFLRWHRINRIWQKGKVYIVVRSRCFEYLNSYFPEEIKYFNLILLENPKQLASSLIIFDGLSSAIREFTLFSKIAFLFLPKKAYILSEYNLLEKREIVKNNKVKIVRSQKQLYKELELLNNV